MSAFETIPLLRLMFRYREALDIDVVARHHEGMEGNGLL